MLALIPIKNKFVFFIVLLWAIVWRPVHAAVVEDLFDAKIEVPNQSKKTQGQAFIQAFKQVLVKVRGNKDILANSEVKGALGKSTRFIRSYTYEKNASQLYLLISFDSKRVENLIRAAGFPVWDKRRPETIVWLAIEPEEGKKELVTAERFPLLLEQLSHQGKVRGVPIIKPLWDLDDRQALNIYDIWGEFGLHLTRASERYGVSSILSARIYQAKDSETNRTIPDDWRGDWIVLGNHKLATGQVEGGQQHTVAQKLIDALADNLASQYAVDLTSFNPNQNKVELVINNVDSLEDYAQVLNILDNLSVINRAELIRQQGTRATFELALLGEVEDLKSVLYMGKHIRPVVDEFGQPVGGLEFFWVK